MRPGQLGWGVANVASGYLVPTSSADNALSAGARRALELGAPSIKLYLTPEYRQKYPLAWPAGIDSLASLAESGPMREVLALPFETVVLTTYSFAMGTGDPWREREVDALVAAEAQELTELVRVLSELSRGTRRTYVLQTWEGDWALTAGQLDAPRDDARAARMASWLTRRHEAIAAARERYAPPGVKFADAVELNRVLDADGTKLRVLTDVLPATVTDLVSYSAWESLDVGALPASERVANVGARMETAIARIRQAMPAGADLFLGEFGFPEREVSDTRALTAKVLQVAEAHALCGGVYWQVFDNECRGGECRGLWLVRPDGTLSEAGDVLAARWLAPEQGAAQLVRQ